MMTKPRWELKRLMRKALRRSKPETARKGCRCPPRGGMAVECPFRARGLAPRRELRGSGNLSLGYHCCLRVTMGGRGRVYIYV